jgi:hypothetical protein
VEDRNEGSKFAEVVEAKGRIEDRSPPRSDVPGQQAQSAVEGSSGLAPDEKKPAAAS